MAQQLALNIRKLLPDVPDDNDGCITLLKNKVLEVDGVISARTENSNGTPGSLIIEYNPGLNSEKKLRRNVMEIGEHITDNIGHLLVHLEFITHSQKAESITASLINEKGILHASASANGDVRVEYDRKEFSAQEVLKLLQTFDKNVSIISSCCHNGHSHDEHEHHDEIKEPKKLASKLRSFIKNEPELFFSIICGSALLSGWIISFFELAADYVPLSLYLIAYFFGGYYTSIDVYHSLKAKKFDIHLLMLVAAIGAAFLGAWAEGALLLFLFSLGHSLEHYAMNKARNAISALSDLTPKTATVSRNGKHETVPINELKVGDLVIIKPGERSPVDGFLIRGESSMNQAPITGESVPVDKIPVSNPDDYRNPNFSIPPQHQIFAGAINGDGVLEVEMLANPEDSTLARIVTMVREAETQKSPTQRFAERFEKWFVPAILIFVTFLLFAWVIIEEPFSDSFYRAMAVMVAASPCALAISTPSAVLSGIARSAKLGVLIKGGSPLELLAEIDTIAFDKTGTITEGNPKITDVVPVESVSKDELISYAIAVEQNIDHPIARAIVRDGKNMIGGQHSLPEITSVSSVSGKGVKADSSTGEILIGNPSLFYNELPEEITSINTGLSKNGRTTMIIKKGDRFLGVIGVMDVPRLGARNVINELHQNGIKQLIMISGDHQNVADAIGSETGLDKSRGGLLPQDKAQIIRELMQSGAKVAMVGDGINDAPAMANASVGIAMGAAGSDVALETADIALMGDDLKKLPQALRLSKATRKIIRQNIFISLGMIVFLVPATLLGYANMGVAVLLHEGSTLVVVLNALRLLGFKP